MQSSDTLRTSAAAGTPLSGPARPGTRFTLRALLTCTLLGGALASVALPVPAVAGTVASTPKPKPKPRRTSEEGGSRKSRSSRSRSESGEGEGKKSPSRSRRSRSESEESGTSRRRKGSGDGESRRSTRGSSHSPEREETGKKSRSGHGGSSSSRRSEERGATRSGKHASEESESRRSHGKSSEESTRRSGSRRRSEESESRSSSRRKSGESESRSSSRGKSGESESGSRSHGKSTESESRSGSHRKSSEESGSRRSREESPEKKSGRSEGESRSQRTERKTVTVSSRPGREKRELSGLEAFRARLAARTGSGSRTTGLMDRMLSGPRLSYLSRILIPVEGVDAKRLHDSYTEGRSGGRTHHAIDIHAPRNTPVLAAADGKILKLHNSVLGGITIYQLDDDGETRYYYAHLERYADGLYEGERVLRGQTIGYVGDSGNAQPGDTHLHFAVALLKDVRRWWDGNTLNPYALLTGQGREVAVDP